MYLERCLCGSMPSVESEGPCYDRTYRVRCRNCGTQSPGCGRDEEEASNEWNVYILNVAHMANTVNRRRFF